MKDNVLRLEEQFFIRAAQHPSRIAVTDEHGSVSYAELSKRVEKLSEELLEKGLQPTETVALLLEKSIASIVAMLAVLHAGAIYVPLNCTGPDHRIVAILDRVKPSFIIYTLPHTERVDVLISSKDYSLCGKACLSSDGKLDNIRIKRHSGAGGNSQRNTEKSELAYLLFTSGSTGIPKGVPIRHESVFQLAAWSQEYFQLSPDDKLSCHSPLYFDGSVWDIYSALFAGAELHLVPAAVSLLPNLLANYIRETQITIWRSVPFILKSMVQFGVFKKDDFPDLRHVCWYGEALPVSVLIHWMEKLPHATFTNTYGPTEATVVCSYHQVMSIPDIHEETIPIGKPIPGIPLIIINEEREPIADETWGELCIGGDAISPGYWNDEEATERAFTQLRGKQGMWYRTGDLANRDTNGVFHFHGRRDRQVKVSGYRIELDEIETALNKLDEISIGVIIAIPVDSAESIRICAVCQMEKGEEFDIIGLKRELSTYLPQYMLPRQWIELDLIPVNANGKIDYKGVERLVQGKKNVQNG